MMGYFQFIPLIVPALMVFFVSLEPINPYKYLFLTHMLVQMIDYVIAQSPKSH